MSKELPNLSLLARKCLEYETVHELEEWTEEDGPVLWWTFPVSDLPYPGTPLNEDWPGIHRYWTRIPSPRFFKLVVFKPITNG